MALVQDQHDPQKQGMFSKAGRFTTEKYIIFQRRDEILHGKKRMLKVSQFGSSTQESKNHQRAQSEIKKKDDGKNDEHKLQKKEENQPFYKQLSREKRNLVKSVKNTTKPVGYYKPKYSEIDKSPHLIWNILKVHNSQTQPRQVYIPPDNTQEEMTRPIAEKPQIHRVKGLIEMGRTIDREKFNNFMFTQNDPHEERFQKFRVTTSWSNIRKTQNFNIDKSIGREDGKGYFSKEHQPDYNPNYWFGKKDFSKINLNITKVPPRKPFFKPSQTKNEQFFEYDKYSKTNKSNIFRNVQSSPNFNRLLPREIDPHSPLPSFMQKHVNMRSTLSTLHHKMLEENYYSDGRFQSTASDFAKTQSHFRKSQEEDEDDEEESMEEQQQQ